MITKIMEAGPVMPVIIIDDAKDAVPLAEALLAGGIRTAEVTLRTASALQAIENIATHCPEIHVGAGTITTPSQARQVADAGGKFGVSPGATDSLIEGCSEIGLPMLYGAQSLSEMMRLVEKGYHQMKFFPASAAGGIEFLKSVHSPMPHIQFCPTGGINLENAASWLSLPHVICVGGSWLAPQDVISSQNFAEITRRAHAASTLQSKS